MHKALLAAALLAATPAFAQNRPDTGAQGPTPSLPNLNNPQAEANQSQQPPGARTDPRSGDAPSIPTPVLNNPTTPTPQR